MTGQVLADASKQLVVEVLVRAVAIMDVAQDGDIMFDAEHADHKLL